MDIQSLKIGSIKPAKRNRAIDKEQLDELARNIREFGVLSPILVRPMNGHHEIVYGHRRFLAARSVGLGEIPAIIRELDDRQALEAQLIENCQRQDIHPMEEAEYFERLTHEHGYSVDDVAEKIGKSRSHVYGRLKYADLTKPARKAFWDGELTPSVALLVARVPASLQAKALKELTYDWNERRESPISFREASEIVQREFMLRLSDAAFSKTDAALVPAAGACSSCPKRTGNQRELFDDVKSADVCTDPICFRSKLDAEWKRLAAGAKEEGIEVLSDAAAKKVFPGNWGGAVAHGSGYIELDAACYAVPHTSKLHGKPFSTVLKEPLRTKDLHVTIARDLNGKIRKLVSEKAASAALRKLKLVKSTSSSAAAESRHTAQQKAADKKARRRRKAAELAVAAIVDSVEGSSAENGEFWKLVALTVSRSVSGEALKRVSNRRGLPKRDWSTSGTKFEKAVDALPSLAARGLAVELLLADRCVFGISAHSTKPYPAELERAASLFGLDVRKIEADLEAAEPEPKAKAKSQRKKAK